MRGILRNKILLIVLFVATLFISTTAFAQDFTIHHFKADIVINQDSSFTVRETIRAEFYMQRHGIYRELPYRYTDFSGSTMKTPIKILSVTDGAGKTLKFNVSRSGHTIRVRIGDPETYVSGVQTYEIFYRVENALLFFDDHDELYWNVTGHYWQAEIKSAECSVSLSGAQTSEVWASCYTGRIGSRETACTYRNADNFIEFKTGRNLIPGEGFTIAYGWNKGIISPPSAFKKFLWFINIDQIWVFAIPLLSLNIAFSFWYRRGRDPRVKESVTVMYNPPRYNNMPLSPAEVGALVDETLDSRDITATIVGLAVKGYIKIEEKKQEGILFDTKDHYILKIKESDALLSLFEKELMSHVFGSSSGVFVSGLKNNFYMHINPLKRTMYSELVQKKYFALNPDNVRKTYLIAGAAVTVLSLLLLNVIAGPMVGFGMVFVAGILTGLPFLGFSRYMPAKTKTGSAVFMDIMGFEEFLRRAEKDQLERMKDENLFSKFFPYALALNVADNWANAFEGIYQKVPDWYVSPGGFRTFSPSGFTHSVNSAMSSLSSAMFSAPRSSGIGGGGFGGGGSSGGGFGGGGGGSW